MVPVPEVQCKRQSGRSAGTEDPPVTLTIRARVLRGRKPKMAKVELKDQESGQDEGNGVGLTEVKFAP